MKIGTKSILFGVHQFLWHPITVLLAWRKLYKSNPTFRECVAIVCHDWGYWGKSNMDGPEGKMHPVAGAIISGKIAGWWHGEFDKYAYMLALCHSRDYAKLEARPVSKLYAADKCSILFDPPWFYILRARLSGEMQEFKERALSSGHQCPGATNREWYAFYRNNVINRPDIKKLL